MLNAIKTQLKLVTGIRFLLGTLAMGVVIFLSSTDLFIRAFREVDLLPGGYHLNFILTALQSNSVIFFVPILAALPFSAEYIDAVKSKFSRYFLIRTSFSTYLTSNILTGFFCGGGIIMVGISLAWCTSALLLFPIEQAAEDLSNPISSLLCISGLLYLNGGLWAVVGMAMSTFMESKYIAYASPFVIYYLLVILCERYFPDAYLLYPPNWTKPDVWPYGAWGAAIFLLELTLVFSILFVIRAGRRLREL